MAKPKRGKTIGNLTYHKTTGGMRKISCPFCKRGVAVPKRLPNGKQSMVCSTCHRGISSTPLD